MPIFGGFLGHVWLPDSRVTNIPWMFHLYLANRPRYHYDSGLRFYCVHPRFNMFLCVSCLRGIHFSWNHKVEFDVSHDHVRKQETIKCGPTNSYKWFHVDTFEGSMSTGICYYKHLYHDIIIIYIYKNKSLLNGNFHHMSPQQLIDHTYRNPWAFHMVNVQLAGDGPGLLYQVLQQGERVQKIRGSSCDFMRSPEDFMGFYGVVDG